jgi:RNA recognition motif-containing protein
MNIFVAKLSGNTTGDDLRQLFEAYGEVSSAKVIMDRETGNSKRFGFVEMDDDDAAQRAIDGLDGTEVDGHQIVVKKALPAEDRPRGPRQGGGGYRGGNSRFDGNRGQRFDNRRF